MIQFRLINTYINSKNNKALERLINSLKNQKEGNFEILLISIRQDKKIKTIKTILKSKYKKNFQYIELRGFSEIGLSNSRNLGIDYSLSIPIMHKTFYLFPDDDCWFEKEFFYKLTKLFDEKPYLKNHSLSLGVFDPKENKTYGRRFIKREKELKKHDLFKPISVGLIINSKIFHNQGIKFNPFFGAGAFSCSGEESLLIAEILEINSNKILQIPDLFVFHENRNLNDPFKEFRYSFGSILLGCFLIKDKKILSPYLYLNLYFVFSIFKFSYLKLLGRENSIIYLYRSLGMILGFLNFIIHESEIRKSKFNITLYLKGGIGNQIFQLFALYKIKLILGYKRNEINFDICSYLFDRKRNPYFLSNIFYLNIPKQIFLRICKVLLGKFSLKKYQIINSIDQLEFLDSKFSKKKPLILNGYFQNINPIDKYSKASILKVMEEVDMKCREVNIPSKDYCAIHIRKTDFLLSSSNMSNVSIDYYKKCVRDLLNKIADKIDLYLFSDDINWVKENFLEEYQNLFKFKSHEEDLQDLVFMSHAKYFVSSNSSFAMSAAIFSFHRNILRELYIPKEWKKDDSNRLYDLGLSEFVNVKVF